MKGLIWNNLDYILILLCILIIAVRSVITQRKRISWEQVEGTIVYSTVEAINYDTQDTIIYQFYYDGILYENKEILEHDYTLYNTTNVIVFINPKDIYKSTIKKVSRSYNLINISLAFILFVTLLLCRLLIK